MKRFDLSANTHNDAVSYIKNRALQISHTGAILKSISSIPEGIWAIFEFEDQIYHSLYLLNQYRGSGKFYELWKNKCEEKGFHVKMLTTTACNLAPYFRHKNIPFLLVNGLTNTAEYQIIQNIYGNIVTKRTGVYYMNHIDEGLFILNKIGASLNAKLGYMLHPIFQSDTELKSFYNHSSLKDITPQAIVNAVEYRSVANEYLSFRKVKEIDEIRLSPLKDVNDMLIADKIQNRKDFELYHIDKHERAKALNTYFLNWLDRLEVKEFFYQDTKEELMYLTNKVEIKL
jgi:hypothetical protein